MTPATVLRRAAARVRRGWTQGCGARDLAGQQVASTSSAAVCWCAVGSLLVELWDSESEVAATFCELEAHIRTDHIGAWNDAPGRTAEEVAKAMESAADAWEDANPGKVEAP